MKLSEKYRLIYDDSNVILQFFEPRTKEKKDGSIEEFEYVDNGYFPGIKSALKAFVQKELKYSESIDEVLKRLDKIEEIISGIK